MCENKAFFEPQIHDATLSEASTLVKNGAICFYPPMESDEVLPYVTVNYDRAIALLSQLPDKASCTRSSIRESDLRTASEMAARIVSETTHIPVGVERLIHQPNVPIHEYLPDGTITFGNRVENDTDILQEQLGFGLEQRQQVGVCAIALGVGHELGHGIAQHAQNIGLLDGATANQDQIINVYTEWFMFSGAYSTYLLAEEQFATGMGYLVASIAAQNLHLTTDWKSIVNRFISDDRRILSQFADLINLLKGYNGNPFSLSLGLSKLQAGLQRSHPELAQKVPQLGPYYIGYYTAINPVAIMQHFQN